MEQSTVNEASHADILWAHHAFLPHMGEDWIAWQALKMSALEAKVNEASQLDRLSYLQKITPIDLFDTSTRLLKGWLF